MGHVRMFHEDKTEYPFACGWPDCLLRFETEMERLRHRQVHENTACEVPLCNKVFATREELEAHMLEHEAKQPYACDFPGCEFRFTRVSSLKRHRLSHFDPTLPGLHEGCPNMFHQESDRKRHMRMVHEKIRCDELGCGKMIGKAGMQRHKKEVHGNEKHVCDWPGCEVICRSKESLAKHKRTHTLLRRFNCTRPGCTKSYAQKQGLERHIARDRH